ncbi:MAG: hypothetical protein ABI444_06865 [Candidatus Kapaibacterium sp.]
MKRSSTPKYYQIPDVRDGLTQLERTILFVLHRLKTEYGSRHVPTALVFGRVVELLDVSREEFTSALSEAQRKAPTQRSLEDTD